MGIPSNVEIAQFIDERNKAFYEDAIGKFKTIEVLKHVKPDAGVNEKIWKCFPQDDYARLEYYEGNESIESFTHEILHLCLLKNGFQHHNELAELLQSSVQHQYLFPMERVGHINNMLAHQKMFPMYSTKFKAEFFVADYHVCPQVDEFKEIIEEHFNIPGVPNAGVECFIGTFFMMRDVRNPKFAKEATSYLDYLSQKDSTLFTLLDNSWNSWIQERQITNNKTILENLINNVVEWHKRRNFR